MTEVLGVLSLGLVCAGWVLLQRWIARRDPENPGLARSCDGTCATCEGRCRD
jgi:hypothetical protein